VLVDGVWYPGWLDPDDWRLHRVTGRWCVTVRWQDAPAEQTRGCFPNIKLPHMRDDSRRRRWVTVPVTTA
jgi:hypothetical protein